MATSSLQTLRVSLTLWYVSTFGAILLLLGGGLFVAIRHQYGEQLEASLQDAARALEQAARTREAEAGARGHVVDAVQELHVAGRSLYLWRADGTPDTPAQAPAWLRGVVAQAAGRGARGRHESEHDRTLRWYAEPFVLASGRAMIAVAVADQVELEERYAVADRRVRRGRHRRAAAHHGRRLAAGAPGDRAGRAQPDADATIHGRRRA